MARSSTTTLTFTCDAKCGETVTVEENRLGPRVLNYANVPEGWEVVNKMWSATMTTSEHVGTPYQLCPKCFRIFEILVMGTDTAMGIRFREKIAEFWKGEKDG